MEEDLLIVSKNNKNDEKKVKKAKKVKFFDEALNTEDIEEGSEKPENLIEIPIKKKKSNKKNKLKNKKNFMKKYMKLILNPIEENSFFEENWEKCPVHISRKQYGYYDLIITSAKINETVAKNTLHEMNISSESNKNNLDVIGEINKNHFENEFLFFGEKDFLIIINPEKYFPSIHSSISNLQDYFSARIYTKMFICQRKNNIITPRSDSTDTFVLQISGSSDWKLYFPNDLLPKKSEVYYDIKDLKPVMSVTLYPGDLLYFPNGLPYECSLDNKEKSTFIFLSITKITWGDFLKILLPMTLQQAFKTNWQFRKNLPLGYLNYCGKAHLNNDSENKVQFMEQMQDFINDVFSNMPIDLAADQLAKNNIQQFIPPYISSLKKKRLFFEKHNAICNSSVENFPQMNLDLKIRLLNPKSLRLVLEENEYRVYHNVNNNYVNIDNLNFIKINYIWAPAIEALMKNYPRFFPVRDLPLENDYDKIEVSEILWKNCLIISKENV